MQLSPGHRMRTTAGILAGLALTLIAALGFQTFSAEVSPMPKFKVVWDTVPPPSQPAPNYPRNASGQTYGSNAYAENEDQAPDLVAVWATNGLLGYVEKAHLYEPAPATPEEALRLQNEREPVTVPVYAEDGKTQIGVFIIG